MEQISVVEKERDLINFLVTTNRQQANWILKNLTSRQVDSISEICHNLLYSRDTFEEIVESLQPFKKIIRILGDKDSPRLLRKKTIARKSAAVLKILVRSESILPI